MEFTEEELLALWNATSFFIARDNPVEDFDEEENKTYSLLQKLEIRFWKEVGHGN